MTIELTKEPCWGLSCFAAYIGYVVLLKLCFEVLNFFYICFLRSGKNLKKEFGEWAIVTGATDGIGKAMAIELARKGQKVLLISRSPDRLKEAAAEVKGETETLALDFSGPFDDTKKEKVAKAIAGKDIGVLVNNVGVSYDHPEYFHLLPEDRVQQLLDLNCTSTTFMTRAVLPGMVERKRGAVVNMATGGSEFAAPLLAEYAASKKYVTQLADSLYGEYKPKGVLFQSQYPLYVTSKLSKFRNATLTTPSPKGYAKAAVKAIGYERHLSPYWAHYVMVAVLHSLPSSWIDKFVGDMHIGIRKKAYKKKEREAKSQ